MINTRLLNYVPNSKKNILLTLLFQIINLLATIAFTIILVTNISEYLNTKVINYLNIVILVILIFIRLGLTYLINTYSYKASAFVKSTFRQLIYDKLIDLKENYQKDISSAKLLQLSIEGVEQLEVYFSNYLPQFFYALLAPIILFTYFSFISFNIGLILFLVVFLIPITIIIVQKIAKKILSKYWGEYTKLGDNFLENLYALPTLKVYQADDDIANKMNSQAEVFRKITMKVLQMQLNSIIVMDTIAYAGSAIGIVLAINGYLNNDITLTNSLIITLLSVEFFLPLRLLGSYFHIASNGLAASKLMFQLLDTKSINNKTNTILDTNIKFIDLSYKYQDKLVLDNLNLTINKNTLTSIVGLSGSGKSTLAYIISGIKDDYLGVVEIGKQNLHTVSRENIAKKVALVTVDSYLFDGTIKENLLIANNKASDELLYEVLKLVKLDEFIKSEKGLDTILLENGKNFSNGQRQRLALARSLLANKDIYIFDEATSNIDTISEDIIIEVISSLKQTKTVILISHRLANVINSDNIIVLDNGKVIETGNHDSLLKLKGNYYKLYNTQVELIKKV